MRPSRFAPATVLLKMVAHVAEDTRQRIGLGREPSHARVAAPPAQLPSRVAAGGLGAGRREARPWGIASFASERASLWHSRGPRPRRPAAPPSGRQSPRPPDA